LDGVTGSQLTDDDVGKKKWGLDITGRGFLFCDRPKADEGRAGFGSCSRGLSLGEHAQNMAHFPVHFGGMANGVSCFQPDQFAKTLAHAMESHGGGVFLVMVSAGRSSISSSVFMVGWIRRILRSTC
jgi:hypothetical protein